jgi:hypothetical protein
MRQIKNTILTIMAVVAVVTQLVSQACTLTAPANLTVNSTTGICGANVTMASAVAGHSMYELYRCITVFRAIQLMQPRLMDNLIYRRRWQYRRNSMWIGVVFIWMYYKR